MTMTMTTLPVDGSDLATVTWPNKRESRRPDPREKPDDVTAKRQCTIVSAQIAVPVKQIPRSACLFVQNLSGNVMLFSIIRHLPTTIQWVSYAPT